MKATTETNAKRNTRQTHRKRTTPTRKFHASHSPTNHTRREPPYRDVPSAARENLTARLGSDLFPFVSLVAFIITTFFLCIDELGELTYFVSGAKGRVLQKQIFSAEYYLSLRSVEIVPKKFD